MKAARVVILIAVLEFLSVDEMRLLSLVADAESGRVYCKLNRESEKSY